MLQSNSETGQTFPNFSIFSIYSVVCSFFVSISVFFFSNSFNSFLNVSVSCFSFSTCFRLSSEIVTSIIASISVFILSILFWTESNSSFFFLNSSFFSFLLLVLLVKLSFDSFPVLVIISNFLFFSDNCLSKSSICFLR